MLSRQVKKNFLQYFHNFQINFSPILISYFLYLVNNNTQKAICKLQINKNQDNWKEEYKILTPSEFMNVIKTETATNLW